MRERLILLLAVLSLAGASCRRPGTSATNVSASTGVVSSATTTASSRPAAWAQPIQKEGLPNLNKVTDQLYRGAQPTAKGMQELKAMGIKTVVNLRAMHSDSDEIGKTELQPVNIPMTALHAENEDVVAFLKAVTDPARQPVFVHCQYGSDRTGTMIACYRVIVQEWAKDDAIREMTEGGFAFHREWQNLVKFVRDLDVAALKRKAGLEK